MTTFNRDQLSDWLHDNRPEQIIGLIDFHVNEVTSKTRSSSNEPYRGICNVEFEVKI